jgi:hypothetical protein
MLFIDTICQSIVHILSLSFLSPKSWEVSVMWWQHHLCSQIFHFPTLRGISLRELLISDKSVGAMWKTIGICPLGRGYESCLAVIDVQLFQESSMRHQAVFLISFSKALVLLNDSAPWFLGERCLWRIILWFTGIRSTVF